MYNQAEPKTHLAGDCAMGRRGPTYPTSAKPGTQSQKYFDLMLHCQVRNDLVVRIKSLCIFMAMLVSLSLGLVCAVTAVSSVRRWRRRGSQQRVDIWMQKIFINEC